MQKKAKNNESAEVSVSANLEPKTQKHRINQ